MSRRESKLIAEIERGALDNRVPLADTLRKCIALGGQTRSAELRDWASRELNGYRPDDELPDWRKVFAPPQIDVIKGNMQLKAIRSVVMIFRSSPRGHRRGSHHVPGRRRAGGDDP